jgi:hypothetical protein
LKHDEGIFEIEQIDDKETIKEKKITWKKWKENINLETIRKKNRKSKWRKLINRGCFTTQIIKCLYLQLA